MTLLKHRRQKINKFVFNLLPDSKYAGLITLRDYEVSLERLLSDLQIKIPGNTSKQVLVDLAVAVGRNQYRFAEYDLSDNGTVIYEQGENNVIPEDSIVDFADSVLEQIPGWTNSVMNYGARQGSCS